MKSLWRSFAVLAMLLLGGCAANQLPGYQPVYYSYEVPLELMQKIAVKFKQNGLNNAVVVRDQVGRVRLAGSYQNELEVDISNISLQN